MPLPQVFVIGDSISMHYGPHLERMLDGVMRYARKTGESEGEGYGNLDLPQGANGGDSGMVLAYLKFKAGESEFQPDVLLVNCGLHDIKTDPQSGTRQVDMDAYRTNLEALLALGKETAKNLVWVRTTPVDDEQHNSRQMQFHRHAKDLDAYNAAADEIVAAAGVASIDLCSFTRGLGSTAEIFCDHVHYVEPVRRLQGAFIAGYLTRLVGGA